MSSTLDRYLFAIRILKDQYVCVRAVDVAHYLRISKPSVSTSIRQMREQGLIEVEQDGNLLLLDARRKSSEPRIIFQGAAHAGRDGPGAGFAGCHFVQLGNE